MARPSVLVVLPLVLATLFATANAQDYTAPTPSPVPDTTPSPPPPPPPPEPSSPPPPPSSSPPSPPTPPPASDWTPVANVSELTIQKVALFAVRIEALSSTTELNIQLLKVVSCETQPSNGGYNYRLLIVIAVSGGKSTQCEAFVWGILGTTSWMLLSFTPKY